MIKYKIQITIEKSMIEVSIEFIERKIYFKESEILIDNIKTYKNFKEINENIKLDKKEEEKEKDIKDLNN